MDDTARRRAALAAGHAAEAHVADRLTAAGATVLDRNWRGGGGELDLVVMREGRVRFVEVKARASDDLDPLEQITAAKQARLRGAARAWLLVHRPEVEEVAFLVAVVDLSTDPWGISWVDDAF